jgi:GTP-binding protein YchF
MALSCGIVGLPNVGQSTIFNALTRSAGAAASKYPNASIEPNVGDVEVPDDRLRVLAEIVESDRIIHATMRFTDIAGLVSGSSSGAGLGNAFLSHIRDADALAMVVRCFEDADVLHVEGSTDPARDVEIVAIEMALADLSSLAKRVDKLTKEARNDPKAADKLVAAESLRAALEDGRPARTFGAGSPELDLARECFMLTAKPMLYVANVDEKQIAEPGPGVQRLFEIAKEEGTQAIAICGQIEAELAGLSDEDATAFREELKIEHSALDQLILAAYEQLGLMTFLTAGKKEVRAWTIARGSKAPQAGRAIHSDIERGFIRAEIVSFDDYDRLRTMEALKAAGLVRSEGKEYVMREGDVVNFRFNV